MRLWSGIGSNLRALYRRLTSTHLNGSSVVLPPPCSRRPRGLMCRGNHLPLRVPLPPCLVAAAPRSRNVASSGRTLRGLDRPRRASTLGLRSMIRAPPLANPTTRPNATRLARRWRRLRSSRGRSSSGLALLGLRLLPSLVFHLFRRPRVFGRLADLALALRTLRHPRRRIACRYRKRR